MEPTPDDLPEAFKKVRERDEPFWQEQERNIQGALGQPCCTLSGIAAGLMAMRGRFAIVIHGEDECAGCFRHLGPGSTSLFCTGLTEQEFVTGRTAEPLRRCLRLVASETDVEAIFVLGACPVEVIGDRFEVVVESVAAEFPAIPMRALHTSGLKVGTQTAMLDWMFETLASLPTVEPDDRAWRQEVAVRGLDAVEAAIDHGLEVMDARVSSIRSSRARTRPTADSAIALVGLPKFRGRGPGFREHLDVLEAVGLRVVANYPLEASLDDWRALTFARNSFVADRSLYPRLTALLESRGQNVVEVPLPIGIKQTREFYQLIGDATGRREAMDKVTAPLLADAEQRLERFRERFGSLKLAYGMRMNNNYAADELAYQGLGDYPAIEEFGFDVTLLVQGPPDKRERFGKMFERRGIHLPFEMFAEPWILADLLVRGGFQAAYLADHCRSEAQTAGIPMFPLRTLDPFFRGAMANCDQIERLLTNILR